MAALISFLDGGTAVSVYAILRARSRRRQCHAAATSAAPSGSRIVNVGMPG
jgi:hypothetical protein